MKELVRYNEVINIPSEVAVCPYCNSELAFTGEEWGQNEDGTVSVSQIDLICIPNEDGEFELHDYDMPYVHWFPVCEKVKTWANDKYDFDLIDWDKRLERWEKAVRM